MKTTWLIGQEWKCSNACSWLILIGRGLDQNIFSRRKICDNNVEERSDSKRFSYADLCIRCEKIRNINKSACKASETWSKWWKVMDKIQSLSPTKKWNLFKSEALYSFEGTEKANGKQKNRFLLSTRWHKEWHSKMAIKNDKIEWHSKMTQKKRPLCSVTIKFPVAITERIHLFPSRTQKLSSRVPMILGWRRLGKVGRCRIYMKALWLLP